MRIAGVASAFPQNYYPQSEIAAALKRHWSNQLDRPEVLDRILARVGVDGRYLALPIDRYDDLMRDIDTRRAMIGLVISRDFAPRIAAGRNAPIQFPHRRCPPQRAREYPERASQQKKSSQ